MRHDGVHVVQVDMAGEDAGGGRRALSVKMWRGDITPCQQSRRVTAT